MTVLAGKYRCCGKDTLCVAVLDGLIDGFLGLAANVAHGHLAILSLGLGELDVFLAAILGFYRKFGFQAIESSNLPADFPRLAVDNRFLCQNKCFVIFYKFEQTCSNVQFIPSPIGRH